jgi:tRNA-(ms[2]io[6]A)-hydroxylase
VSDAPKRRLPVVQANPVVEQDAEEVRTPWHWVAFGVVAAFCAWLPLAALAASVSSRLLANPGTRLFAVALHGASFVLACGAAGFLVGRFGGRAGRREATASGLAASALAWVLGLSQGGATGGVLGWGALLVVLATLGSAAAAMGGGLGVKNR